MYHARVPNNVEEVGFSHSAAENIKSCNHLGKHLESFLKS